MFISLISMQTQHDILFLPQEVFFMKTADLPEGIAQADVKVYAETLLESFSPLGLDLLRWGYVTSSSQIFIFAAPADRLQKSQRTAELMDSSDFVTCFASCIFGLDLGDGWSLVKRDAGELCEYLAVLCKDKKWCEVYAVSTLANEGDAEAIKKFAKMGVTENFERVLDFSEKLGSMFKPSFALLNGENFALSQKIGGLKFLSTADVRDSLTLKIAKKNILFERASWGLVVLASVFFVILLFWKLSLILQGSEAKRLDENFVELAPQAMLVKNMMDEAIFLQSLNSKKIENVMMLAKINKYRPEGISFAKSVTKSPNVIEIKGKAQSVMVATQFERQLRQSEIFKNVKLTMSGSGSGGTSWTLNAEFKD